MWFPLLFVFILFYKLAFLSDLIFLQPEGHWIIFTTV